MELAAAGEDMKALRGIARKLIANATAGEMTAINAIADRLDGKPAQESTVTIDDKRDSTDWTRAELVAFLDDCRTSSAGTPQEAGRSDKPDIVH